MATNNNPAIRQLAQAIWDINRRLTGVERTPQLANSSLDDTGINIYDSEGEPAAVLGKQDDGSFGVHIVKGPTPVAPSAITAESGVVSLVVSWDGEFAGYDEAPRDYRHVAIHVSSTPDFEPTAENTRATFTAIEPATRTITVNAGTYYLKATTVSIPGMRSEPTPEIQQIAEKLVDDESIKAEIEQARTEREEAAQEAQDALTELEGKLGDLTGDSGELQSIRDALTAAQEAVASAQSTASEAVTAANAASQAALEAAGIAASKGRVIVQEAEPQGEDRKSSNIWIQPVPDDPDTEVEEKAVTYVYLEASDEWVPTTSSELAQAAQNALDAREAAQQAQQRADTAIANAAAAQATAQAAKSSADGKNTIRFSFSDPTSSSPGERPGDTWWRANTDGNIIGQWTWNGAEWDPVQLRSEVIANLDVSKLSVHDSATINEAVIGRLFADIFTAHKITASELSIASVKPDGSLADNSVGAVTIKDGAVNADKITADAVTAEKIKAGEIETGHMKANSIDADRLVANSITADKIGANEITAEKISGGTFTGETFEGGTFVGSEFRTSDVLPGQITLSDTSFVSQDIQTRKPVYGPGISIDPENGAYTFPPGIGPSQAGILLTGGWNPNTYGNSAPIPASMEIGQNGIDLSKHEEDGPGSSTLRVTDSSLNLSTGDGPSLNMAQFYLSKGYFVGKAVDTTGNRTELRVHPDATYIKNGTSKIETTPTTASVEAGSNTVSVDSTQVTITATSGGTMRSLVVKGDKVLLTETGEEDIDLAAAYRAKWTNIPLGSGWSTPNHGYTPRYARIGKRMYFAGRVSRVGGGNFVPGETYLLATFNGTDRPAQSTAGVGTVSGFAKVGFARIELQPSGDFYFAVSKNTSWVGLDGYFFDTE